MRTSKTFYSLIGIGAASAASSGSSPAPTTSTQSEVKDIRPFIASGVKGTDYTEDLDSSNNLRLDRIRISSGKHVTLSGGTTGIRVIPTDINNANGGTISIIDKNETKVFTGSSSVQKLVLLEILAPLGSDGIDHFNIKSHIINGVYTQPSPKTIRTTTSVVFKPLDDIKIIKDVYWYQPPAAMDTATQAIPQEIISIPKGVETTITHTYISPVPGQNTFSFMHLKMVGGQDSGVSTVDNPITPFDTNPHPDDPTSDPNTPVPPPVTPPVVVVPPVQPQLPTSAPVVPPHKTSFITDETKATFDKTVKGVIIGSSILLAIWAISAVIPKLTDSVSYVAVRERQLRR